MNVFTYGTLQFPEIWRQVTGRTYCSVTASLHGYAVFRIIDAVYPGMIPAAGDSTVTGVTYLDVDRAVVARLDRFEGDCYARWPVQVDCADGLQREAWTYLVRNSHRHRLTDEPWRADAFAARGDLEPFVQRFSRLGRLRDG